jgi:hypothetical protein
MFNLQVFELQLRLTFAQALNALRYYDLQQHLCDAQRKEHMNVRAAYSKQSQVETGLKFLRYTIKLRQEIVQGNRDYFIAIDKSNTSDDFPLHCF